MAENIRNRQQWCAVHQECTCKGTSQRMDRFSIFSCQACVCNVFLKRRRYGSAGLESTIGMKVPNKDIVTIGINLLSIMYSKEDILFAALKVDESRTRRWCRRVEEPVLQTIRKLPNGASMEMLKSRWYQGHDGSNDHYDLSRYHAVNLHSVFYHGTVEFRLFNATLHAGEVKANIVLAMAISAQAINQQKTLAHKTPIGDNPAFTFRTFLLRLGLIGPEYKNVREHLLKNLPGDRAWRYDKAQYPCNQRHRDDGAR